ncbi:hypothetical protein [Curtobacterium luteum]|uniref:Uncharacterized protein n=1 Tax=Curtobacterium luteum TaxID=33881 RepID=A0A175RX21_9MICO|nr:hypothetical protein [Curtobacterium luteum]KTR08280.1 hypothetical protein NS184_06135 [Curtobacterium luteum]
MNSAQFVALQLLYPVVKVSSAQFDSIRDACTKPQAIDAAVHALPSLIPLEVQGASEEFIENVMGQVVVNANTNANTVNANVVILRDQVKAHVTVEADRVIAAI